MKQSSYLSKFMQPVAIVLVLGLVCAYGPGETNAAVTLLAPYDTDLNLNAGSPSTPTVVGSVTLVAGAPNNANAAFFDPTGWESGNTNTNFLTYGAAQDYISSFGGNNAVESATFRVLYKPADVANNRRHFVGLGGLAANTNGIYLAVADTGNGPKPALRLTINGTLYDNILSNSFTFDTNKWYYIAGSFDATGSNLYVRELSSDPTTAFTQTVSFSAPNWGSGSLDTGPVYVGSRYASGGTGGRENARGALDQVVIVDGEKWNDTQFGQDYQFMLVPEPGPLVSITAGLLVLLFYHLRRRI